MSLPLFQPGLYRHYKGGLYMAMGLAWTHNHNGDIDVVYVSLEHGEFRTRPYAIDSRDEDYWDELLVWPDGVVRHRFSPESEKLKTLFDISGDKRRIDQAVEDTAGKIADYIKETYPDVTNDLVDNIRTGEWLK